MLVAQSVKPGVQWERGTKTGQRKRTEMRLSLFLVCLILYIVAGFHKEEGALEIPPPPPPGGGAIVAILTLSCSSSS